MKKLPSIEQQPKPQGEVILYQPDETISLEVQVEDDTVWLTQQQMAELFERDQSVIARHIRNIYNEKELAREGTYAKFAYMGHDGLQRYEVTHYNLDVIISVGYRVKSKRGTQFRQWANMVIRNYLLRGYVVNQQLHLIEQRMDEHMLLEQQHFMQIESTLADHQEKIDFFVRTSLPPVEGVFYDGQIFDAHVQVSNLIKQAKKKVVLIDNYIDETTLTLLNKRGSNIDATIYTRPLSQEQQLDLQRNNQQYLPVTVNICQQNHDRFLIIDDEVYAFGASLKDAGKKLFAYIKMNETSATELLSRIR